MYQEDTIDDFDKLVVGVVIKQQKIDGLLSFLKLASEKGIDINNKIVFLGEYQRLLFESLVLDIFYILIDKEKNRNSKMQNAIDSVEQKLQNDIEMGNDAIGYTLQHKKDLLAEIKDIKESRDYKIAINIIQTIRNKRVAHKEEFDFSEYGLSYTQVLMIVENIKRCNDIRRMVLFHYGKLNIMSPYNYNHQNIIEALVLQSEVKKQLEKYNESALKLQNKICLDLLDFWDKVIKQRVEE